MNATIKLNQMDVQAFRRWLRWEDKETQQKCQNLIARTAEDIARGAQSNASGAFDNPTGRLQSSIKTRYTADKMGATVAVGVDYGPYKEFGTGELVEVPSGLEDYAMQFKGAGLRKVNQRPKPYFFSAVEKAATNFFRELKQMGFDERP